MVDIILSSNVIIRILFLPTSVLYTPISVSVKCLNMWVNGTLIKPSLLSSKVKILKVRTSSLSMYMYPVHWTGMIGCPWLFHMHTFKPSSRSRDKFYTTQKEVGE